MGSRRVGWALLVAVLCGSACSSGAHSAEPRPSSPRRTTASTTRTSTTISASQRVLERTLAPPRVAPRARLTWAEAEKKLGFKVPARIRAFYDAYGAGNLGTLSFDDLRTPERFENSASIDLANMHEARSLPEALPDSAPRPPYPTDGAGLVPIADNEDNGVIFAAVRDGALNDDFLWIVDPEADTWVSFRGPLSAFVADLANGGDAARRLRDIGGDSKDAWQPAGASYYEKQTTSETTPRRPEYYFNALSAGWDKVEFGVWSEWHVTHLDGMPHLPQNAAQSVDASMRAAVAKYDGSAAQIAIRLAAAPYDPICDRARDDFGANSVGFRNCVLLIAIRRAARIPPTDDGLERDFSEIVKFGFRIGGADINYWIHLDAAQLAYINGAAP